MLKTRWFFIDCNIIYLLTTFSGEYCAKPILVLFLQRYFKPNIVLMRKILTLCFILIIAASSIYAQNVGIGEPNPGSKFSVKGGIAVGTNYSDDAAPANGAIIEGPVAVGNTSADPSAILDLSSANQGVKIPSVDLSTASFPSPGPATSLMVWNNNAGFDAGVGFYFNSGTPATPNWVRLSSANNTVTTVNANNPLSSSGGTTPTISLTGTVPVSNGGTGRISLSGNSLLVGNGSSPVSLLPPSGSGNFLQWTGTNYQWTSAVTSISNLTNNPTGGLDNFTFNGSAPVQIGIANGGVDLTTKVTGVLPVPNGGTGRNTLASNGIVIGNNTGAVNQISTPNTNNTYLRWNGTGYDWVAATTNNADLTAASGGGMNAFTYNGSTATQISIANQGVDNGKLADNAVTSNKIQDLTITNADIANGTIDLTTKVTGVLPVTNGGTGVNTVTGVVIGNGTSAMTGVGATNGLQYLRRNSANTAYEFAAFTPADANLQALTNTVSGGLNTFSYNGTSAVNIGIANQGVATAMIANNAVDGTKLNLTSNATGDMMYYDGTDWVRLAAGLNGQSLRSNGAAAPTWANPGSLLTAGTGISIATNTITNTGVTSLAGTANQVNVSAATGAVTLSLPQNIHTGAGVTFNTVTATNDFFGNLNIRDTRSVNSPPSTYDNEVSFDFKLRSTISAPGGSLYGGLMTVAPWGDNSGGFHHQVFFADDGIYYRNGQPDNTTTWNNWSQILTSPTSGGTNNYHAKFTGTNSLGNSLFFDNGSGVSMGNTSPRGVFDINTNGDIYLVNSPNTGTSQSLYVPGHIFVAPYNATNTSYIQARRADNSGTTNLQFRTYNAGALTEALLIDNVGNAITAGDVYLKNSGPTNTGSLHYGTTGRLGSASTWTAEANGGFWIEGDHNDFEGGGIFMNGNTMALWSTGDNGFILSISDEDNITVPVVTVTSSGGLEARNGLKTRKTYKYYQNYFFTTSSSGVDNSATTDLGVWDFCAVAQFGFKNNASTTDEDDDAQCAVYPVYSGFSSGPGEQTFYNSTMIRAYNEKPNWTMYFEAFDDTNGITCAASCINFE